MRLKKSLTIIVITLMFLCILGLVVCAKDPPQGCTVIGVGKDATVDGSVITSHTDCGSECRIRVIPAQDFPKGAMAPVYWGMVYFGNWDPELKAWPLGEYGRKIGEIPQVEHTYAYFHSGYSHMNEHQLAIGETTCSQKPELDAVVDVSRQIMTIEQATVFALQRAKTAREAIKVVTSLMEKYGFLPSCGGAETLCIADPKEAWVLETFGVGPDWDPDSGELGAIWAARRIPDNHVTVIPNYVRIREIDLENPDFMASKNYMQVAIDHDWYDPASGEPFIWQEAYAPPIKEGNLARIWLVHTTVAPNFKDWPKRKLIGPTKPGTIYGQVYEGAAFYPFSVPVEKKLSVQDIIALQRSVFEDTIYDITANSAWLVPDGNGGYVKSPLTTPFATGDMLQLLNVPKRRGSLGGHGYGMVAQLRDWLPASIGGLYYVYLDKTHISTYMPIYAGVQEIHPYYKTYDWFEFDENSARWAIEFVGNLLYLNWQEGMKDLKAVRDPLEASWFAEQLEIEDKALKLYKKEPAEAKKFLTEVTKSRMEESHQMFVDLRYLLISKYKDSSY